MVALIDDAVAADMFHVPQFLACLFFLDGVVQAWDGPELRRVIDSLSHGVQCDEFARK